jgi:hypothetical protein
MKTIKNLTVTVTYSVGLVDVEMPEKVYDQIVDASENCDEINPSGTEYLDAAEWLSSNVREADCMDWSIEIDDISY